MPDLQLALIWRLGGRIGVALPSTKTYEPTVWHRLGTLRGATLLIGFVLELVSIWFCLADTSAGEAQRTRERLVSEFREMRRQLGQGFRNRRRLDLCRSSRIGIKCAAR